MAPKAWSISAPSNSARPSRRRSPQVVSVVESTVMAVWCVMLVPSYLVDHGPQLVASLIAWIGAALAFVAALTAKRSSRWERSALVVTEVNAAASGGLDVIVENVGERFALGIALGIQADPVAVWHGGVAGGGTVQLPLTEAPGSPAILRLTWTDADGRAASDVATFRLEAARWLRCS